MYLEFCDLSYFISNMCVTQLRVNEATRLSGDFKWARANKDVVADVTYTVTALSKDALYEFRVAAENRAGVGPTSDPAETRAKTPVCECSGVTHLNVHVVH